ncbi:uncharacterized protein LY89DRAFT_690601 [Mollisia scopiformis]|uniref:Uncharacterized protein n=1 Tax=Mollisia scopiformis TaxID=149040 RepID=A0A132B9Z1_MOLSC|nr:uncharacterized protein LY89DRAFT_690601 [Mollisia scopiformis]KUJ09063.1 hypothetical protein LY89DRAFT_690601 [Mollisia scopiformis]
MSDTEMPTAPAAADAVEESKGKSDMPQADIDFIMVCIKNAMDGVLTVDAVKIAEALGYSNVRSVGNRVATIKKKYGLAMSVSRVSKGDDGASKSGPSTPAPKTPRKAVTAPKTPKTPKSTASKVTKTPASKKKAVAKKDESDEPEAASDDDDEEVADEEKVEKAPTKANTKAKAKAKAAPKGKKIQTPKKVIDDDAEMQEAEDEEELAVKATGDEMVEDGEEEDADEV